MLRRVGRHLAGGVGGNTIDDLGIQVGVAGKHLPAVGDTPGCARAEAVDADLAAQRIGGGVDLAAGVVLGDLEDRRRQRQVAAKQIPLAARFIGLVLFRVQALLAHGAGQLLQRRVERGAIRHVVGLRLGRLPDAAQAHAGEVDRLLGIGQCGVAPGVGRVDRVGDARDVTVVAHARHRLPLLAELDRVVQVGRQRIGRTALQVAGAGGHVARRGSVAGIDQRLAGHEPGSASRGGRGGSGVQRHAVAAAIAEVVLVVVAVVAHLGPDQQRVLDRPGVENRGQFGLVEDRVVTDLAVMALQAHRKLVQRQRAGGERREAPGADRANRVGRGLPGIGLNVVELRLVAQPQVGRELVRDAGVERRDVLDGAVVGEAVEGIAVDIGRMAVQVREAIVRHVAVMLQQRRQRDLGRGANAGAPRRRDAKVPHCHLVARARLAVLRHGRDAERRGVARGRVVVGGGAHQAVGGDRAGHLGGGLQRRLLADLVDHAAGGAAAEQHRRRPHQHLDLLEREGIAIVLAAVAEAVQVNVGPRREAVQVDVVADLAAFGTADGDTRHVAQRIGQRADALRFHQRLVHHGDRLRHVAQVGGQLA
ncbi:hypothetical protein D9M72_345660 [compost metagenome]